MTDEIKVTDITKKRLLADCKIFGLDVKESIKYVKAYTGKEYAESTMYEMLEGFDDYAHTEEWLQQYSKTGYLVEQRESLDSMHNIKKVLLKKLLDAQEDSESKYTDFSSLSHSLVEIDKRIEELRLGTPIIARLKKKLEPGIPNGSEVTTTV